MVGWVSITFVLRRLGQAQQLHLWASRNDILIQAAAKSAAVVASEHLEMFPFCPDESGGFGWIPTSVCLGNHNRRCRYKVVWSEAPAIGQVPSSPEGRTQTGWLVPRDSPVTHPLPPSCGSSTLCSQNNKHPQEGSQEQDWGRFPLIRSKSVTDSALSAFFYRMSCSVALRSERGC